MRNFRSPVDIIIIFNYTSNILFLLSQFIESDIAQDNFEGTTSISRGGTEVLLGDPLLKADNR